MTTEVKFYCATCNKEIIRPISHLLRNINNYCSRECYDKYKNPNDAITLVGNTSIERKLYNKIHRWIVMVNGKATICENVDCKNISQKNFEWALIKGKKYDFIAENFMQMCASCHRKYDETAERKQKISLALSGRPSNSIRKIMVFKEGYEEIFNSIKDASEKIGISRTGLQNVLSGISKTAGGYKCHYQ